MYILYHVVLYIVLPLHNTECARIPRVWCTISVGGVLAVADVASIFCNVRSEYTVVSCLLARGIRGLLTVPLC